MTTPIDWPRLLDCEGAAAIIDRHPQYVPELVKTGRLDGRKIGKVWVIDRLSCEAFTAGRAGADMADEE